MEQQKPFLEVVDAEKELLALIYAKKGSLDDEVLKLYRRIRTKYEDVLLKNDETSLQYQEIEYHLWKLHYKLIDEFRRTISRQRHSAKPRNDTVSSDSSSGDAADHKTLERYKSFLSESSNFYTSLIVKLRKKYGFPPEIFLGKDSYGGLVSAVEKAKSDICQHSCHRLLVCLGDLVRYSESCKKPGDSDWSAAAKYYLEAAKIWPDSGNPHNQLALLARHVGDPFLALYHLVRSLFVEDPFPDAWRNILLLFDESRSTDSKSPSRRHTQFDFLNPSEKISSPKPCNEENCSDELELWPILVRTMSFFFIRSSFEDFPSMFASTVHRLEVLLESNDDANLITSMESYQCLDSSKKGPYRAVQIVSIFIFVFHNITNTSETEKSESNDRPNHDSVIKPLAVSSMFICMGRLIERCHTKNRKNSCPLLPAVLVFLEWLAEKLDMLKAFGDDVEDDKRVLSSLSYFSVALSRLLQRMDQVGKDMASDQDNAVALWEDYELKGFYPLARIHRNLSFKTVPAGFSYDSNHVRSRRVFLAASRILELSGRYTKVIQDKDQLSINSVKTLNLMDDQIQEVEAGDEGKPTPSQGTEPNSGPKAQHQTTAEEEIIVFKPITRRNSAPIKETKPTIPDESLRRATSLYTEGQHQAITDSSSFSFHHYQGKENTYKDSPGPPSLSAWVPPSQGGPKARDKEKLSPIEEIPYSSTVAHSSPLPHTLPIPSAPLLPEEPLWLTGNPVTSLDYYRGGIAGNEGDGILGAAPRVIHAGPGIPNLIDSYNVFPPIVGMSSSEWLYHYRNNTNARGFGNYNPNEVSGFDPYDQRGSRFVPGPMHHYLGSPLIYPTSSYVYGGDHLEHLGWDKGFLDYEMSSQQPTPLLQYLKERERQLQLQQHKTGTQFKNL